MIREIAPGDRWRAAMDVEAWGYPRRVSHREVETGRWFNDGHAIAWYVSIVPPGQALPAALDGLDVNGVLAVHAIRIPGSSGAALTPRSAVALEVIAELLGARKLYSLIPRETPDMPVAAMRRLLRRFGWIEDQWGSYKLLGG